MEGAGAAVVGTGVVGASVGVTVPPQALGAARRHKMFHKGQLISECLFGVISFQKTNKKFDKFLP